MPRGLPSSTGPGVRRDGARHRETSGVPGILRKRTSGFRAKSSRLRRALIQIGRDYVCEACGNEGEWQGEKLILDVDHIDGDRLNNSPGNLRFLCPNCHRITPTWGPAKNE